MGHSACQKCSPETPKRRYSPSVIAQRRSFLFDQVPARRPARSDEDSSHATTESESSSTQGDTINGSVGRIDRSSLEDPYGKCILLRGRLRKLTTFRQQLCEQLGWSPLRSDVVQSQEQSSRKVGLWDGS